MSEPTIDEMIAWLSVAAHPGDAPWKDKLQRDAIRTILEQHREPPQEGRDMVAALLAQEVLRNIQREAIRAFVERVEKRLARDYPDPTGEGLLFLSGNQELYSALQDELAAMEKEAE